MARTNVINIKVDTGLAQRVSNLISDCGLNTSRNQLIEQLIAECCDQIDRVDGFEIPPTIIDIRRRLGKSHTVLPQDLQSDLVKRMSEIENRFSEIVGDKNKPASQNISKPTPIPPKK